VYIGEIIQARGINPDNLVLARHSTHKAYVKRIIAGGNFDLYQSLQKSDVYRDAKYVLAFTHMEKSRALLHGLYEIKSKINISKVPEQIEFIRDEEGWKEPPYIQYKMAHLDIMNDLQDRLVIDWGSAPINWVQSDLNKEITEILPKGFVMNFPGYDKVLLTFDELARMISNPDANRDWKTMLGAVYGIYLILDTKEGRQYVGSASGKGGLWNRWEDYTKTKHGNNKELMELLKLDPERYKYFQYSILNVLPNTALKDEVLSQEALIKEKLGTRVFGLNAN
jgi:hypothetical protein